jgi:hypothetical protein
LAERIQSEVPDHQTNRIRFAWRLLFGREVTNEELDVTSKLIALNGNDPNAAWIDLCHVLLCSNEFIYLD